MIKNLQEGLQLIQNNDPDACLEAWDRSGFLVRFNKQLPKVTIEHLLTLGFIEVKFPQGMLYRTPVTY